MAKETHNIERELEAYVEHINNLLHGNESVVEWIPITEPSKFFEICHNGFLLSHLLNAIKPGTVDTSKLKRDVHKDNISVPGSTDAWEIAANNNIFLEGCKKLGIKVVNVGSDDVLNGNVDLVLGLIWQLIRAHLLSGMNVVSHPQLIRLLEKGETIQTLLEMAPDKILLRWFNYHLNRAGHTRKVSNFAGDVSDSENYIALMRQIAPRKCDQALLDSALADQNLENRANAMLKNAELLNSRKFVTAKDIVAGHSRLNLAFTATLFNQNIGIRLPSEEEIAAIFDEIESLKVRVAELESQLQESEMVIAKERSNVESSQEALESEKTESKARLAELKAALDDVTAKFASGASFSSHLEAKLKETEEKLASQSVLSGKQLDEIRRHRDALKQSLAKHGTILGEGALKAVLARNSSLFGEKDLKAQSDGEPPSSPGLYTVGTGEGVVSLASHDALVSDMLGKYNSTLAADREAAAQLQQRQLESTHGIMELIQSHLQNVTVEGVDSSKILAATLSGTPSLETLRQLVIQLMDVSKAQHAKIQSLEATLLRKTQMAELMTIKIREIAEELNMKKADGKKK